MAERDYALAVLDAADEVPGRTMLQKLVYLAASSQDDPLWFRPHFYGPYSSELQSEVERLVALGLVEETVRLLEPWQPSTFDPMQYSYRITDAGRAAAREIASPVRDVARRVVETTRETGAWNAAALSMAAKLHHLRLVSPNAAAADVPSLARQFGWRMTESDARVGERLLESLSVAR
ncbi:MAG TPA: hypothetical protein VE011_06125 [Candidatus Dormibacteraeota bacterium]|nr:hypothetical protein [Candidatus Dormibacteraeota bacterium]